MIIVKTYHIVNNVPSLKNLHEFKELNEACQYAEYMHRNGYALVQVIDQTGEIYSELEN